MYTTHRYARELLDKYDALKRREAAGIPLGPGRLRELRELELSMELAADALPPEETWEDDA